MYQQQQLQLQQLQQQSFNQQHSFQPPHQQFFQPPPPQQQQQESQQTQEAGGSSNKRSHRKKDKGVARESCNKRLWSPSEEVWLAKCWVDASEDSRKGNSQKRSTLWSTIHEKFNDNDSGWVRGDDQLSGKWRYIDRACKDFHSIYNEEDRTWGSGRNDKDIYDRAVEVYQRRNLKNWTYKDCWEFLKDKPKWYAPPPVGGEEVGDDIGENQTVDLSDDQVPSRVNELFGDDPIPRPMGRDRARKAARSSASSDAATSSRGTNSSKMEELIENINAYKSTYLEKKSKTMDLIAEEEKIRSAMEGAKFLAMDTDNIANPRERKRVIKMKKVVLERYREYLEVSSDEDEDN